MGNKINDMVSKLSPILISPSSSSITLSISKRFFLFKMMNKMISVIEEDPYLNFISLLKNYKVLGRILYGTLHEFHRDRDKSYFKNFFIDDELHASVKADIEYLYPRYKDVKMTITKRGIIVYDNYDKSSFNTLLMTAHSGTWLPKSIERKLNISQTKRMIEEDIDTHKIYCKMVLDNGGIWVDNKLSRFGIDFNRSLGRAIYADNSEKWLDIVWKEKLTKKEADSLYDSYKEFYFTLARILETYSFNLIFDGHSMRAEEGRPNISFGTRYIPKFYLPIVRAMQSRLKRMGYSPVAFNRPYSGGYILKWLNFKYPNIFICSMEINKRIYMNKKMSRSIKRDVERLQDDLAKMIE